MRFWFVAFLLWGTSAFAQDASPCGPKQTIGEANLQALIETSANSYARSSSKENVLLQALMRDSGYFGKIFPKRDPNVVGGYYFNTVCRSLIEQVGGSGKLDALSLEKLRYVASAFKNPPSTVEALKALSAGGAVSAEPDDKTIIAELPVRNPARAASSPGSFGETKVTNADSEDAASVEPSEKVAEAMVGVEEAAQQDSKPQPDVPAPSMTAPPEAAPSADVSAKTDQPASGRLPAIAPLAIPQTVFAQPTEKTAAEKSEALDAKTAEGSGAEASTEQKPQAAMAGTADKPEEASGPDAGRVSNQASLAQDIYGTVAPSADEETASSDPVQEQKEEPAAPAVKVADRQAQAVLDLEPSGEEGSAADLPAVPETVATPSCGDMRISSLASCQKFETVLGKLKSVPLEITYPKNLQPGEKARVSLTFRPENGDVGAILAGSDSADGAHMLQANLIGDRFDILPKGPQKRVLNSTAPVRWTWIVTPVLEGGGQTLALDFAALVQADNRLLAPVSIKSYRNDINVESSLFGGVSQLAGRFHQTFLATFFIGLIAMMLLVLRRLVSGRGDKDDAFSEPTDYAREIANYQSAEDDAVEQTMFLVSDSKNR